MAQRYTVKLDMYKDMHVSVHTQKYLYAKDMTMTYPGHAPQLPERANVQKRCKGKQEFCLYGSSKKQLRELG